MLKFIAFAALAATVVGGQAPPEKGEPQVPDCGPVFGRLISTTPNQFPEMNAETEVEIGQTMVSLSMVDVMEAALTLNAPVAISGTYVGATFDVAVPAGVLVPTTTSRGLVYAAPLAGFKYRVEGKPRSGRSSPTTTFTAGPSGLTGHIDLGLAVRDFPLPDAQFTLGQCRRQRETSFKQELIYSGVSKGTLSISYKEFSDDLARPAFTQELKYDLAEGNEIGFRGSRFKVLSADNLKIRYVVLKQLVH